MGATLTDCFKIKATAGAGPFYLRVVGGTSDSTAWVATASINLTLTRVNPY
jgi:hypothetical protein